MFPVWVFSKLDSLHVAANDTYPDMYIDLAILGGSNIFKCPITNLTGLVIIPTLRDYEAMYNLTCVVRAVRSITKFHYCLDFIPGAVVEVEMRVI